MPNDVNVNVRASLEELFKNIEAAMQASSNQEPKGLDASKLCVTGLCIALDILAQNYYFNLVFKTDEKQCPSGLQDVQKRKLYELHVRDKNIGIIFRGGLEKWGIPGENNLWQKLHEFRNKMVHHFSSGDFLIETKQNAQAQAVAFLGQHAGKPTIHLQEFYTYLKQKHDDLIANTELNHWIYVTPYLETW